jgi:CheY-like chemotaxis protein
MKGDKEKFLKQTQADDYIAKPIATPQDLIDKVNHLLSLRQAEYLNK